jgi:hypothetical protein
MLSLGCNVTQLVVRRYKMVGLGVWRRMNDCGIVLYEWILKITNIKKECQNANKPLKLLLHVELDKASSLKLVTKSKYLCFPKANSDH